jgi:excisionase family DNA binding protein
MSICSTGFSRDERHLAGPLTVTVETARKISGLGNTTIWALIKNGTLESVSVGRRRLILFPSLERLLAPKKAVSEQRASR